jgi:CBS domain-containing protein
MPTLDEIMTRNVFTASPDTPVAEVAQSMVKGRVGSAVIVKSSMLVGILTERDVLRAAASGEDLTASVVGQWMTRDPQTADPGVDADEATQLMLGSGFRHLPVMDGNTIVGIVSLRDVLSSRIRRTS